MKKYRFILLYLVLLIAQVFLCNYFGLSRYVLISVLPALILTLPLEWGSIAAMLAAFATGFAVDFFSNGLLGITSAALVPVGLVRRSIIGLVFGDEFSSRGEQLSTSRLGLLRFALSLLMLCSLYFAIFIWIDSAGTAGFWQCFLRFMLSLAASTPVCVFAARLLRPE